jgi:hypothetical protein
MLKKLLMLAGVGALAGCQGAESYEQAATPPAMNPPAVVYAEPARPLPQPTAREVTIPGAPYRQKVEPQKWGPVTQGHAYPFGPVPRAWIPAVKSRQWLYVVVHHSDSKIGSAAIFDRYHREVHHWNSLGYDFVIGNGSNSGDGEIEVGPRWRNQEDGAHAGVKYYNEEGIGICLVGDFAVSHPTPAQLKALAQLTGYLQRTYHIAPDHVIGHKDCGRKTNCPGRFMDLTQVRRMAAQYAGIDPTSIPDNYADVGTELMHDAK